MTALAALLAGIAVALLLGSPPVTVGVRGRSAVRGSDLVRPGPSVVVVVVVGVAALVPVLDGVRLALAAIIAGTGLAVAGLVRRVRVARDAERRRGLVVEVAEALVGELRAGQPLVASLEHCTRTWPELDAVVAAARLGADVPTALRRLASRPGAEGLREVASAWQVSERSGAGLAAALAQVAETARTRQATRDVVRGELASAQATARLVALLPFASLLMSAGAGGRPWHFLFSTPPGLACLGAGLLLAFAGLLWIDRIAAGVLRG